MRCRREKTETVVLPGRPVRYDAVNGSMVSCCLPDSSPSGPEAEVQSSRVSVASWPFTAIWSTGRRLRISLAPMPRCISATLRRRITASGSPGRRRPKSDRMDEDSTILFEIGMPLGFTVRTSTRYWQKIILKHPDLADRLELIKKRSFIRKVALQPKR